MSSDWEEILKERFGDYASEEHEVRWLETTKNLSRGDPVEGVVLAHSTFGAWIDIGLGFPALIEIIHIVNMTPEKYREDDYYPPGSKIEAMIRSCTPRGHQMRLEQVAND